MEIFDETDYRIFVRKKFQALPKKGHGQFRKLALELGVNSVVISQIMAGDRDFSLEQACEVSKFLGLTTLEGDYFLLMVQLSRAGTVHLKSNIERQMSELQKRALKFGERAEKIEELDDDAKSTFYSSWIYSGIQMASALEGGRTLSEISEKLKLSNHQVAKIIEFLLRYQLCLKEEDLFRAGPTLTHINSDSPMLKNHFQNWRIKAFEKMDDKEEAEFFYSCPMVISKKDVLVIKKLLVQLIEKISKIIGPSECEELVCLNIDWFNFGR